MKKLFCVLLAVTTCVCLYGQTEEADNVAVAIEEEVEVVEIVEVVEEVDVDPDEPLFFAEEMPLFVYKNGDDSDASFRSYMADSIRIPSGDCKGKVYVQFVVERDSTVDKVEILRGLPECEGYEEEVRRLLLSMPKWIPGRQGGNAVRVKLVRPVEFIPRN